MINKLFIKLLKSASSINFRVKDGIGTIEMWGDLVEWPKTFPRYWEHYKPEVDVKVFDGKFIYTIEIKVYNPKEMFSSNSCYSFSGINHLLKVILKEKDEIRLQCYDDCCFVKIYRKENYLCDFMIHSR